MKNLRKIDLLFLLYAYLMIFSIIDASITGIILGTLVITLHIRAIQRRPKKIQQKLDNNETTL